MAIDGFVKVVISMPIKFYEKHKDFLALALRPKTRALFLEGT